MTTKKSKNKVRRQRSEKDDDNGKNKLHRPKLQQSKSFPPVVKGKDTTESKPRRKVRSSSNNSKRTQKEHDTNTYRPLRRPSLITLLDQPLRQPSLILSDKPLRQPSLILISDPSQGGSSGFEDNTRTTESSFHRSDSEPMPSTIISKSNGYFNGTSLFWGVCRKRSEHHKLSSKGDNKMFPKESMFRWLDISFLNLLSSSLVGRRNKRHYYHNDNIHGSGSLVKNDETYNQLSDGEDENNDDEGFFNGYQNPSVFDRISTSNTSHIPIQLNVPYTQDTSYNALE